MSIGSLSGVAAGIAGAPLAQTKGAELERAPQEVGGQQLRAEGAQKAEAAAGIGEADGEEHAANERDADGRRPWQAPVRKAVEAAPPAAAPLPKDPSGQSGSLLDLTG
jgi:hypothetical protein